MNTNKYIPPNFTQHVKCIRTDGFSPHGYKIGFQMIPVIVQPGEDVFIKDLQLLVPEFNNTSTCDYVWSLVVIGSYTPNFGSAYQLDMLTPFPGDVPTNLVNGFEKILACGTIIGGNVSGNQSVTFRKVYCGNIALKKGYGVYLSVSYSQISGEHKNYILVSYNFSL